MTDKFDVDCPECGGRLRFSLEDLARERTVRCSGGHDATLKDEGGGAAKATRAVRDLERSLQRLDRSINIRL